MLTHLGAAPYPQGTRSAAEHPTTDICGYTPQNLSGHQCLISSAGKAVMYIHILVYTSEHVGITVQL